MYKNTILSLLLIVFLSSCTREDPLPNFVFVLVDDLGWTDLGVYGSTFYETPNLDRIAAESMVFTNGYACCQVCSPSRASISSERLRAEGLIR